VRGLPPESRRALAGILAREDPDVLAVFVSGSAARGMATEHSDVDVYLVLSEEAATRRATRKSAAVDEIVVTLPQLEAPGALGTDAWWYRWSFAWVEVLRDDTGGRLARALAKQAKLEGEEQVEVLLDRLDGFINFAFRSLKSERDGRRLEQRLDAAESVTWWLDVVFALAGRVRPYNKYLAWELRSHPVEVPDCSADEVLTLVERLLDGESAAVRDAFAIVERAARTFDEQRGDDRLASIVDGWGDEQLALLRAVP
jgi:predicted nucleotidyltransferase